MAITSRTRTILTMTLAAALAGAAAVPALAAPTKKLFTATVSPASAGAGLSTSYTLTVTNSPSSSQSLGSANISVPAGFTVTSSNPLQVVAPAGKSWTASLSGTTIQVRSGSSSDGISAGQSVGVTFTATNPCTVGSYSWTTLVKQSNNFLGTNNDFSLVPGTNYPQVAITAGDPVHIQFTNQPTDTQKGHSIDGATGVKVRVTDTCTNVVAGTQVTMEIGVNPPATAGGSFVPGVLSGTLAQNTNSLGVATFGNLSIDQESSGYTLIATAPSVPSSIESQTFDVTTVSVTCTGGACSATGTSGTSSLTLDAPGGTGTLSLTFESHGLSGCPDFTAVGGTQTIDPPAGATLPVVATFDDTIPFELNDSYPVCKTVEVNGVVTGTHLVPFCTDITDGLDRYPDDPNALEPCISEQSIHLHGTDNPPTLHTVMLMTSTDPRTLH